MTDVRIRLDEGLVDADPANDFEGNPILSDEAAEVANAAEAAKVAELLAKAGLDHVPTVIEAKELLEARRTEIRRQVLLQADARDWCLDGTRQVCANLRLTRPGDRTQHQFEVEVTLKLTVDAMGFTPEGAVSRLQRAKHFTSAWFQNHLYSTVRAVTVSPIVHDGQEFLIGDNAPEVQP